MLGQDQHLADSLETVYDNGNFEEEHRLQILCKLSIKHPDLQAKMRYTNELLSLAQRMDSIQYLYSAYLEKGNIFSSLGEMPEAIDNYLMAGDAAIKNGDSIALGTMYGSVANVYQNMENYKRSVYFHKKTLRILRNNISEKKDTSKLAISIMNLGYVYVKQKKLDSALICYNESGELFDRINDTIGLAYVELNKGSIYAEQQDFENAESNINSAFPIIEKYGHFEAMCETLIEISAIYLVKNETERAAQFAHKSLDLAMEHNLKPEISRANLQLSKIYEQSGRDKQANVFFKDHILYRDSVTNLSSVQEIANMRTEFEVSQKQAEIELKEAEVILLNEQKTNQRVLVLGMVVILGMTGLYYWNINKEKRKSDDLLLNILPSKTAEELKKNGQVKAKKFESVTVMFTDFQAFTKHSQKLSPEVLVKSVDYYFSKFDDIIEKYHLEKIKTIGDAYMCVGGLNIESPDHHIKMIEAAFKIAEFVKKSKHSELGDMAHFDIRIGINTGAIVAGVVGKKKFAYDIWGDSVNVASRMETNSEVGKINVSENTYQLIKNDFNCKYRGEIEVKNKGLMRMYFVEEKKGSKVLREDQRLKRKRSNKKVKITV
ncbi:adenylate/guanylate cyclase domain-containing protein [Lutimonas sp.]|uniref:adenylate/guanylate cyclase domain-containing protein n=1 Tax=Lutimonas sp. TaxID=1872403 RepID=UPI003D9B819B